MGEREVVLGSTVVTMVTVVRLTSSTGRTDGNGRRGLELEEFHYTAEMSDLIRIGKSWRSVVFQDHNYLPLERCNDLPC